MRKRGEEGVPLALSQIAQPFSCCLTPSIITARAGELSPGRAYSRTSRDERRKNRRERGLSAKRGLFLTIKLTSLRIVATEAYVAFLPMRATA